VKRITKKQIAKRNAKRKRKVQRRIKKQQRKVQRRLEHRIPDDVSQPMFKASNIKYELADKTQAMTYGGIGLMHKLARNIGLIDAINNNVHVLKLHLPYHESDHVLNLAYNALCGGHCLEDIELRRNDPVFLDALGTERIPDPTTAGDFCRRFKSKYQIDRLQNAFDEARIKVWQQQPESFFDCATIDMDGHLVETTGECKVGMDIAYDGTWGYHPLLVSLANTGEVLRVLNRSGNRPSHEGAAAECDSAMQTCRAAGFRSFLIRGDTDFSQTKYLDAWNAEGNVTFHFGYAAMPNLIDVANTLPEQGWKRLKRHPRYEVKTKTRSKPENIKEQIVVAREFDNIKLNSEDVAEFMYQPTACSQEYRMIVLRKNLSKMKGEKLLFDDIRYFFYITNDEESSAEEVIFSANNRCNQENLIAQLKGGTRSFKAPLDNLYSNWSYMVMTSLAWNLKAWLALSLSAKPGRWQQKHQAEKSTLLKMEFRTFVNRMMLLPCQVVKSSRRLIYRLLNYSPHLKTFFRLVHELEC